MNNEIWKEIEGYDGDYLISNLGKVKSLKHKNPKILKPSAGKHAYLHIILYKNKKPFTHKIHRLVAEAFIPNPNNKPTINHINGIKTDNNLINLEWTTYSENTKHAYDNGLHPNITNEKAVETLRISIYSNKLNLKFKSLTEAGNYLKNNYFNNVNPVVISNAIGYILNNKNKKSKYDFGWVIMNNE